MKTLHLRYNISMSIPITCQCGHTTINFKKLKEESFPNGYKAECCRIADKAKRHLVSDTKCRVEPSLYQDHIVKWLESISNVDVWTPSSHAYSMLQEWLLNPTSRYICQITITRFGRIMKTLCDSKRTSKGVFYKMSSYKSSSEAP